MCYLEQEESVDASTFLETVVDVSELIVLRDDAYEFAHLSFQEYLAASYIAVYGKESVLYEGLAESWWKPTILLYAGIVNPTKLIEVALKKGAINLAYECVQETRKRIDKVLKTKVRTTLEQLEIIDVEVIVQQVTDARYADLERYLKNSQWEKADEETYRLMITEVGKEVGQWFDPEDLLNFPCEPLRAVDGLWVRHSGGKFGFSVQKDLYLKCGGSPNASVSYYRSYGRAWEKLCKINGWNGRIRYGLETPTGHLPAHFRTFLKILQHKSMRNFFSCIQTCQL